MRYLWLSLMFLGINLLYSAYTIDLSKDYAKKVAELKREKEKSLKLKAQIEELINYKTAKSYAESIGFEPIDWSKVKIVKSSP
ncbi:MAG: hypothetical protein AB1353_04055 [Aquificota bacterium]|jgi:hypothetical protein|nr:hypothetical protein [Aquificaceae bacterium]MDM7267244.1 hypothetical protein [Aquificaceae bacterium]QWK12580.1 MAG: hypothetical protein KNN14_06900 [Aquificota bacterium]